jgi:diadenosine tetraphosphate (Ap4A) HIT family hydrolase
MSSPTAHAHPLPDARCVFCAHAALDVVITETEHFLLIADHAPLAEGHLLIVPRDHYACYGALPSEFDDEAHDLRERVTRFLRATYRAPIFFEHGVFRQTVFHAHLHALPLGAASSGFFDEVRSIGSPALSPDAVRAWYAGQGHYFYLDTEQGESGERAPLLFPAEMGVYFHVMGTLRSHTATTASWIPPALRQLQGRGKMHAVATAWHAYFGESHGQASLEGTGD